MKKVLMTVAFAAFVGAGCATAQPMGDMKAKGMNPCNPCAGKMSNPCNPCANKEHKKAANPCAKSMKMKNPCNPCAKPMKMKNPCNPCGTSGKAKKMDPKLVQQPAGVTVAKGNWKAGEKLWNNPKLGTSGAACATCHVGKYTMMQPSFGKTYPHPVNMAKEKFGLSQVNAAEMVQLCMVIPMKAKPLNWKGKKLADLTAYVNHIRRGYKAPATPQGKMANPCNPCAKPMHHKKMKNPCNPCAKPMKMKNPCGM